MRRDWLAPACVVAALGGVLASPAVADDLPARLTLAEALRLLRERGLDLLIADAQVEATAADVQAAAALANPTLTGGVGRSFTYDPSQCAGCSATAWSAGVSDQGGVFDVLEGRRARRVALAQAVLAAARRGRADVLRVAELQVRHGYVAAAEARGQFELATEQRAVWARLLDLTRVRFRAGAISEAAVAKAETATLSAAQDASSAAEGLALAKANLAYLLGARGPVTAFEVDTSVLGLEPNARLLATPAATLVALARRSRPDLAQAAAQVDAAQRALAVARRLRAPGVTLSLLGTGQGTGQNAITPPTLSLQLAVTPPLLYRFQGEIGRAQAALRAQELALAKAESQVATDVAAAHASYRATAERVSRTRAELLPAARRARDLVRVQYEKGAASFLELLDAERTLLDIRRGAVRELADHADALFLLQAAIGQEPPR